MSPPDDARLVAGPRFRPAPRRRLVPSYRYVGWRGYRSGEIAKGSANRTRAFLRLNHVDRDALEFCLDELYRRHPVLGALYCDIDAAPWLDMEGAQRCVVSEHLLKAHTADPQRAILDLAETLCATPFDLDHSLCRAFLISAGAVSLFVLSVHHLISDKMSMDLISREIDGLYRARQTDRLTLPRPDGIDYHDYLVGLAEWLEGPHSAPALSYWTGLLPSRPTLLKTPLQINACSDADHESGILRFQLGADFVSGVDVLSRRIQTTRSTVMMAIQAIVIARVNSAEDVILALITDGRDAPVLRPVFGYMADKLHYRMDLGGDPTVEDVGRQLHDQTARGLPHRFMRYDYLHHRLWAEDLGTLFPSTFNYRKMTNAPPPAHRETVLGAFRASPAQEIGGPATPARINYIMEIGDRGVVFEGSLSFSRKGASLVFSELQTVLAAAVDVPGRRLSTLPPLGDR